MANRRRHPFLLDSGFWILDSAMLERVTAGDALYRVIRTLTESRPLDDILAEVLSQTRAMLDAAETYILLTSEGRLTLRASDGLIVGPNGLRQFSVDTGIEGMTARTEAAVVASSLVHDPRHVDPFDRPEPVGSMLAVPLILRGHLLGVLVSTRRQPGRFAGVETWWLDVFGGLVASVIASDQAYRLQQRRVRQAEAILALSASDDSPPVSETTVAEVAHAVGTECCGILLLEPNRESFDHTFFRPASNDKAAPHETLSATDSDSLRDVMQTGRTFTCYATEQDPTLQKLPFLTGVHCLIATPVRVSGTARGILYVGTDAAAWLDGDEAFLELVATRIGLMIERGELRERQRDVERQQVQMAARQEFLGIVSHELKTPVAVMRAYTELLLRRAERGQLTAEIDILRRMTDQSERMLAMIEQLLDSRRLEAGLLTLEVSHFDLGDVLRRLAHETELAAGSHTVAVDVTGRTTIKADRRRIEEVFTNLLDNAVKYSPPGGTIQVRVTPDSSPTEEKNLLVSIHDQGPGIAPADHERVFERFFQATGHLHKGRTGLGLGLFISRELVRRHGGEVWVESKPGEGSTFFVRLPIDGPATAE
jgi:signal transduction histidine kinase